MLPRARGVRGIALLAMWRSESGVGPAANSPSAFWELLALLGREPGREWLLRCPNGCTGSLGSSGQEPGGGDRVDELSHISEKHPLGPWPLKTLMLLEGSGNNHQWQLYCEGLKNFLAFKECVTLPAIWPVPVGQVKGFLVNMECQDLPPTKTITYMEGLSFISRMVDHPDPLQDCCHVMSRLKCRTALSKEKYSPVTTEVLRSLLETLESVCSSPYECILFHALFTVAFRGGLRTEEIVANHRNVVQSKLCT